MDVDLHPVFICAVTCCGFFLPWCVALHKGCVCQQLLIQLLEANNQICSNFLHSSWWPLGGLGNMWEELEKDAISAGLGIITFPSQFAKQSGIGNAIEIYIQGQCHGCL